MLTAANLVLTMAKSMLTAAKTVLSTAKVILTMAKAVITTFPVRDIAVLSSIKSAHNIQMTKAAQMSPESGEHNVDLRQRTVDLRLLRLSGHGNDSNQIHFGFLRQCPFDDPFDADENAVTSSVQPFAECALKGVCKGGLNDLRRAFPSKSFGSDEIDDEPIGATYLGTWNAIVLAGNVGRELPE
eukprot:200091_1